MASASESSLDQPPYPISFIAMILFGLSAMLDTGKHDDITLNDVKEHASKSDLIEFLNRRAGGKFEMGICEMHPAFARWYVQNIQDNCTAMSGRERRKYAIENRGLCLLISYTAELLQGSKQIKLPA
jgi:hypothetical protein